MSGDSRVSTTSDQRWLRVLLPLASATLVASGFSNWASPLVYDPLVPRLGLAAVGLGLGGMTFHPRWRHDIVRGAWLWGMACTLWFEWVAFVHAYTVDDLIGLLVIVALTGVFCETLLQVLLLLGAVLLGLAGFTMLPDPQFSPPLGTMLLALAGGVLGAMSVARVRLLASLEDRVQERTRELSASLTRLEAEVRERHLAELEAERANQAKTRFLQTMSHELRTPLTAVLGYTEIIGEELAELEQDVSIEDLGRVEDAARHLLTLIDQMLDLTRIESSAGVAERRTVQLAEVVAEAIELAGVQGVQVEVPAGLTLQTDPVALRQVLINLLDNARRFSPAQSAIRVCATGSPQDLSIEVHDQGPGIAPEDQARIFGRFVQLDNSTTRRHDGAGLGLAVAHELVRWLGGTLTVASAVGKGSTFTVRLER